MNDNAQAAIFIDYDNIEISVGTTLGRDARVEWKTILETASRVGRLTLRRAYGDWSENRNIQRDLLGMGIDLVHVSSKRGKNAADIRIVIDALEMLYSPNNHLTHIVLVSGDGDFTELVHRLRSAGKVVIGLGVSGTSAEYLVNACDEFIYYDKLATPPSPPPAPPNAAKKAPSLAEPEPETPSAATPPAPSFDITEARLLLRRVLESWEGEWMLAAELKKAMLRLNPAFNERNYSFSSFKNFLQAQIDMINLRTLEAQLEAQLIPEAPVTSESLLESYLQVLAGQKMRITPNEYRPAIIFKFYEYGKNGGVTFNQIKDRVHAHFEENAPHVTGQYITETAYQLFYAYCFTFDPADEKEEPVNVPAGVPKMWGRKAPPAAEVTRATEMLDRCDRGVLQKLLKTIGAPEKIDKEAAARVLYGSLRGERMLAHVADLLAGIKPA